MLKSSGTRPSGTRPSATDAGEAAPDGTAPDGTGPDGTAPSGTRPASPPRDTRQDGHDGPEGLWWLCGRCRQMTYRWRLDAALGVCPSCGHHSRLTAPQRLDTLLDPGWTALPHTLTAHRDDPLGFHDTQPYTRRLERARAATGLRHAVVTARGAVAGHPVTAAAMDFRFLGGSLGTAEGEVLTRGAEDALRRHCPYLVVTASGGARMQEGALSLLQMARTAEAFARLDEAGLLTVCLVTDPTYGGVAASFASLCDVLIAEPGARMGFAGPRVIAQTVGQSLPEGFQTAEFLKERGLVDDVRERAGLRTALRRLLATAGGPAAASPPGADPLIRDPAALPDRAATELVQVARQLERPTARDHFAAFVTDFEELRGDRTGEDSSAVVGGTGRIGGVPVMVVGHQKGHTPAELVAHGFGMPQPAGYRKAARLMRLAQKLGLPVVTLIDTPGAYPGVEAEEHGQAVAIAGNLRLMATLRVPVVAVVTGEGGSGGALALGVADRVLMFSDAMYSVISPEGCAAILWDDPGAAARAAEALKLDARSLLGLGVVDAVLPEPPDGVAKRPEEASALVRDGVLSCLAELAPLSADRLVAERSQRLRRTGGPQAGATGGEAAC